MKINVRQRIISGITALSIFSSALFPAATVFSEEMPSSEPETSVVETTPETAGTDTDATETSDETVTQSTDGTESDTESSVEDSSSEESSSEESSSEEESSEQSESETTAPNTGASPQAGGAPVTTTVSDEAAVIITDNNFSCSDTDTDISLTVNNGMYILDDGTDIAKQDVSFVADAISVDDYIYQLDVDRRVKCVRAYNMKFEYGYQRVVAISNDVTVKYTFTEDVPEEEASSVAVYTVQSGVWTQISTDAPVIEYGYVKSVSFKATLPELDMFCVVWTDPESVKPDESILSSDRNYYYSDFGIEATATAFTGAMCTGEPDEGSEGAEYGALPENANNIELTLDVLDEYDERRSLFDIKDGETVSIYSTRFFSEKYHNVTVSDYETEITYTLSEPVPEDKAYSVMAFVPGTEHMTLLSSEKIIDNGYITAIRFTVKDGIFAVFENISLNILTVSAENEYTITVKYDKGAGIPDGAELSVSEENADYYLDDTADALGWTDDDYICYTRFFYIAIMCDGIEYEPQTPVIVTADLHDATEAPEALQVVHINDEGASEVEIGSAADAQITFAAESFSVYGFGSALHTVLSENNGTTELSVFSALSDSGISAAPMEINALTEGLETENAFGFTVTDSASVGKLWIMANVAEGAELDGRESFSVYSVYNNEASIVLIPDITENEGLCPVGLGVNAIALIKDTGFRRTSFDIKVDGEESGKSVTMDGMMPKAALGQAIDVTGAFAGEYAEHIEDKSLLAAYDLSIFEKTGAQQETTAEDAVTDGTVPAESITGETSEGTAEAAYPGESFTGKAPEGYAEGTYEQQTINTVADRKYQPGEERPVHIEITDPRITSDGEIFLYHLKDDNVREEITEFEVTEGQISFEAAGFSVYEVVKLDEKETTYDIVDIPDDDITPTDFTTHTVTGDNGFEYDVVNVPAFDDVGGTANRINTADLLKSYLDQNINGFYISGVDKGNFIKDYTVSNLGGSGEKRTGLAQTDVTATNSSNYFSFVDNAKNDGAVRYFFESVPATNKYYIYCYSNDDNSSESNKLYVYNHKATGKYNSLSLTSDIDSAMTYTISTKGNTINIRCAENGLTSWWWNHKYNGTSGVSGFGSYDQNSNNDSANNFYMWYYTPPTNITEDPCHLDGETYGLVSSNNALMAGFNTSTSDTLGAVAVTSGTNLNGDTCFESDYGITGWTFEWIPGTTTHKISAVADDGASKKYLQVKSSGNIALVDNYEDGSVFTISANATANTIKLTTANGGINYNNSTFRKGTASEFYLVDLSAANTDALGLDGKTVGLINKFSDNQGNALMCEYKGTNTLANQSVWFNNGTYSFEGGITEWTFDHVDFNRYTLSAVDKTGATKYLKLMNNSGVTLSDEPFILTAVQGSGDYAGTIKLVNTSTKTDISNDKVNSSFKSNNNILANADRWFTLVDVPEAPASDPLGFDGKTYGVINPIIDEDNNITGGYALTPGTTTVSGKKVTYDSSTEQYKITNNFVSGWTFHWKDHNNYTLSVMTDNGEKYLKFTSGGVSLVDASAATPVCVEAGTGDNAGKIRIMPLLDGTLSVLYRANNNGFGRETTYDNLSNDRAWHDLVEIPQDNEAYSLDNKTYGLMSYTSGTHGYALMAENPAHSLVQLITHNPTTGGNSTYYVDEGSTITRWTFHNVRNDLYTISSDSGYLKIVENDGVRSLAVNDVGEPTQFKVTFGTGNNADKLRLSSGSYYISCSQIDESDDFMFGLTTNGTGGDTLLTPVDFSKIEEPVVYSAERISVSDAVNGQEVIIYTRIWNEDTLRYDIYALDANGTMFPCYATGGKIMWLGDVTDSLKWTFIEYTNDEDNPTWYYELYSEYSDMYLAPQLIPNQLLSEDVMGLNMPGRKNGEYFTEVIAWDFAKSAFIGIKPNDSKTAFVPCAKSVSVPIYFATMEELNQSGSLHIIDTVDNNDFGITMKMINFGCSEGKTYGDSNASTVTNDYFGGSTGKQKGLLTTDLKANGYPDIAIGATGTSFADVFQGATEVNHLFILNEYNSAGYFEFDSCQNYATLCPEGSSQQNNFTVYRELGTHQKNSGTTLKHGQFYPYDWIQAGKYSTSNNQNLYSQLADPNNSSRGKLEETDPRKYEKLHLIQTNAQKNADFYFGMELSANFTQTVSGLDAWGHDIIFEFSGDDDFWLYVDDELILDLGGIHSAIEGSVNFRTGEVIYDTGTTHYNGTTTTNLREIFKENYISRNPGATEDEVNQHLAQYFAEGENIFLDYTKHNLRMFYMERGANASNLYMRFNLSSVTPGHVVVSKDISGDGAALLDSDFLEYPFQIYYEEKINETQTVTKQLANTDEHVYVTYQNSETPVRFAQRYRPPGFSEDEAYANVFFINPTKNSEISFPDNTIRYRLVECAVDENVYPEIKINGQTVSNSTDTGGEQPFYIETVSVNGKKLRSYSSNLVSAESRPTIIFDNVVNADMVRTLQVKKVVRDKDGQIINYPECDGKFQFRLGLSTSSVEMNNIPIADFYNYYVADTNNMICRWDPALNGFASTGITYSSDNIASIKNGNVNGLTSDDITFHTGQYGTISNIPAGYSVFIPGLVAGEMFRITEDDTEGYGLDTEIGESHTGYKMEEGSIIEGETTLDIASYTRYTTEEGKLYDNVGYVDASQDPLMTVNNKKGYSLTVKKVWSDSKLTKGHDPIYVAVYKGDTLVKDTLREIRSSASAYYFWGDLNTLKDTDDTTLSVTSLDELAIKEVKLVSGTPVTDSSGYITNIEELTFEPLGSGERQKLKCTLRAENDPEREFDYIVTYTEGEKQGSSRTDTVYNTRDAGIKLRLFNWETTRILNENLDQKDPLSDGIFILYKLENGKYVMVDTYTSDEEGKITVMYDFNTYTKYKLIQTSAPRGFVGLSEALFFEINDANQVTLFKRDENTGVYSQWSGELGSSNYENWADTQGQLDGISAFIDVYNKPFELQINKFDAQDESKALKGAIFALYKQTNDTIGGYSKSKNPMTGFERLEITNDDGSLTVCGGNSGRSIKTSKSDVYYFLTETDAPDGYSVLGEDIVFKLTSLGKPILQRSIGNGYYADLAPNEEDALKGTLVETSDGKYVYTLSVPNSLANSQLAIQKQVDGNIGDKSYDFEFTISVENAADDAVYAWTKNGEVQTPLADGGKFTLRHNGTAVFTVPSGVNITITETATGYTQSFRLGDAEETAGSNGSYTFSISGDTTLVVTNTINTSIPTGAHLPEISVVFAGFLALGVIFLARRERLRVKGDDDES